MALKLRGLLAAFTAGVLACTPENSTTDTHVDPSTRPVYTANLSEAQKPEIQRTWTAGDMVAVYHTPAIEEYMYEGNDGSLQGTLKSSGRLAPSGDPLPTVYAVYPFGVASSYNATEGVNVRFPTSAIIGRETEVSIWVAAANPSAGALPFQCATAYVDIPLYGDGNIKSVNAQSTESITGRGTIAASEQGLTVLMAELNLEADELPNFTLTAPQQQKIPLGTTAETATVIRYPLPAAVFNQSIALTVEGSSGTARGIIKPLGSLTGNTVVTLDPVRLDFVKMPSDNSPVPFTDEGIKAYSLAHHDLNNDGVITMQEANIMAHFINMSYRDESPYKTLVKSVDDFQYFTKTFSIGLSDTDITSMTFRNNPGLGQLIVAHNPKLEHIDFHGAPNIGILFVGSCNFSSLDVSSLSLLYNYYCENNSLKILDLSANPRLLNLHCYNNLLESLDLSKNPHLEEVDCDSNPLKSLNVSKNTNLTRLSCNNTLLTELDVSAMTELQHLSCGNNKLTFLDISNMSGLVSLSCESNQLTDLDVSDKTKLETLSCYNNAIRSLDVRNSPKLSVLWCEKNQIKTLDVSNNTLLRYLNCWENQIASLDVSRHPLLEELYCFSNAIRLLDVKNSPKLSVLSCGDNRIETLDVSNNTQLIGLYCGDNLLTSLDVSHNAQLTALVCCNNPLTSLDVSHNAQLEYLYCCDIEGLTVLDVSNNPKLADLNCWNKNLKELWLKKGQVIPFLQYNPAVTVIKYKE